MNDYRQCSYRECDDLFRPRQHNQKYCTDQHCKEETNARIMEQYYEKKANRSGRRRVCKTCDTVLSRYNNRSQCARCDRGTQLLPKELLQYLEQ